MNCLDEETTLGLVEGRLAAAALDLAEAHLDGCESCREVVTQLARANAPAPRELAAGQQLGKYVVGDLLGAGAMGRVYAAHQADLDRKVAIKVLHDVAASDRLLKEAQSMARLDHPNVVGVYEVGTLDDGGVYAVMDLVEGDTLRAWAATPRDWREITRVLVEIARGLAAVHAAGVIHRDIKPDNIIVGADGRVRLGDFGLARGAGTKLRGRLADSASFDDTVVATPSVGSPRAVATSFRAVASGTSVAGTPVYMASELLEGKPATAASDQFAYGVTAYELIAGKRPFTGATWAELTRSIARDKPPVLDAPRWLDATIRRCLAVDPAARFPSMSAVASELEQHAQRRKPRWIAGAAAAAVIASGATWAATRGGSEPPAPASCALGASEIEPVWNAGAKTGVSAPVIAALDGWTARWASEHDATCVAAKTSTIAKTTARERCLTRQRDELAALLDRSRTLIARRERPILTESIGDARVPSPVDRSSGETADRLLDVLATMSPAACRTAEPNTADALPADPDRARDAREVDRALPGIRAAVALGDLPSVEDRSRLLVEQARASTHAPTLADALLVRGDVLRGLERFDEAAIAARDAVAAAERGHDDQTAAQAWLLRVGIAVDRRDFPAADDLAALADANVDRAGAPPRLAAQLLRLRGTVAYYRNRFADATALLGRARERFVALAGEKSVEVAAVETMLGTTARAAGDLETAERHHRAALAIDRELRGPAHFDLSRDLHNLAGVLRLQPDLDGASELYRQALAIETATRGERSVQAGLTHNSLGLVAIARRDFATARAELARALDILTAANHGDRAFAEANLGIVEATSNKHAAALAHYDRAAAIYATTTGEATTAAIRLHLDRARSLHALGRNAQARASATKALDAAILANITWIAVDAKALLAMLAPAAPRSVAPGPDPQPLPPAPTLPPDPIRDVGSYGSNPGRP